MSAPAEPVVALAKWTSPSAVEWKWIKPGAAFLATAKFCNDAQAIHVARFSGATQSEVTRAVYRYGRERYGIGPDLEGADVGPGAAGVDVRPSGARAGAPRDPRTDL